MERGRQFYLWVLLPTCIVVVLAGESFASGGFLIFVGIAAVGLVGIALAELVRIIRSEQTITKLLRGQCGVCGYDLRFNRAECPECGTVIDHWQQVQRVRHMARALVKQNIALFKEPEEYVLVDLRRYAAMYPGFDRAFIETQSELLQQAGLVHVMDVREQNKSKVRAALAVACRVMMSPDGDVLASVNYFPIARWGQAYFRSEAALADGSTLMMVTLSLDATRQRALRSVPGIDRAGVDPAQGVPAALAAHRSRVAAFLETHPGSTVVRCRREDVAASQRRTDQRECDYWRSIGYVPIELVREVNFPVLGHAVDLFIEEIRKVQEERGLLTMEAPPKTPETLAWPWV